jgi:hypothetical protein
MTCNRVAYRRRRSGRIGGIYVARADRIAQGSPLSPGQQPYFTAISGVFRVLVGDEFANHADVDFPVSAIDLKPEDCTTKLLPILSGEKLSSVSFFRIVRRLVKLAAVTARPEQKYFDLLIGPLSQFLEKALREKESSPHALEGFQRSRWHNLAIEYFSGTAIARGPEIKCQSSIGNGLEGKSLFKISVYCSRRQVFHCPVRCNRALIDCGSEH